MNENNHRASLPATHLEPHTGDAPTPTEKAERLDTRVNIRVISYRKRRHDPDGVSAKAVLDGLVQRGILPEDSCEEVKKITFESHIAKEEKTIIEITLASEEFGERLKEIENMRGAGL